MYTPTHALTHRGFGCTRIGTHSVHVDAVGVGPGVLEVLLQPLPERVRDLVEADELSDSQHLGVVAGRPGVQSLDDG